MAYSREVDVQDKLISIFNELISKYRFEGIELEARREFDVDGKRADIVVVLKPQDIPLLVIETKRKDSKAEARRIDVFSKTVIGQALCYATLAKRKYDLPVTPFFATANPRDLVLFGPIERPEELVDIGKCEERDYEAALRPEAYSTIIGQHRLYVMRTFAKEDIQKVLEDIVRIWIKVVRTYRPELLDEELKRIRWPLGYWLIEHLRNQFIDYLSDYFVRDYLRSKLRDDEQYYQQLDALAREAGYKDGIKDLVGERLENVDKLARMMLYVLLNKIIFYKVLERHYRLPPLKPLLPQGMRNSEEYLSKLSEFFNRAIEITRDFEVIFETGLFDKIVLPDDTECLKTIDSIIELFDRIEIEKLSDIIGHIYEKLIPAEERHSLGQFYTPPPIAELIVKWCIRGPNDKVLDPGCGSGTFLVEAYKRLFELKTGRKYGEHYPNEEVHEKILNQLYSFDINPFPAQLSAMNLAMRNTKVPSRNVNTLVTDFFAVIPGIKALAPYTIKTPSGEMRREIEIPKEFDAVVGNPPYTRWTEIIHSTQDLVLEHLGKILSGYGLTPQVSRGAEIQIYVYWIIHATQFLKEGGRLGMIISDSWLQSDYGINFFKYLLNNYKIHAIIDISSRVFPIPLIATCIILLEKCSNANERISNRVVFMSLNIPKGEVNVDEILSLLQKVSNSNITSLVHEFSTGGSAIVKVYRQGELLEYDKKIINLLFNVDEIIEQLRKSPLVTKLTTYFEPSRGNAFWSYWALKHGKRPDVGGEEFFYLTEEDVKRYSIPKAFAYPLLPSSDYMGFFTFTENDWKTIRNGGAECYLFLAHKPRSELPESVRRYIELGERDADQGGIALTKGKNRGRAVAKSTASQTRKKYKQYFYDWYDLGGVIDAPIYVSRGTQYWIRFVLAKFKCALDDRILALVPKQGVAFDEKELKALLAFLNSSFSQLQAEVRGRSTGGGMIELDVRPLGEFLVLDVKKLSKEDVERLAQLFDKLESEARRLGGANVAENVFGSELARELMGRDVRGGVEGLWNTVIKEIDYEVARILGLEGIVEHVRAVLLDLVRRRLERAREARPTAIRGESTYVEISDRKRRKGEKGSEGGKTISLDRFFSK